MGTADAAGHHRPWVTQPSISSGILARSFLVENLRAHACARQAVSGENLLGISTTLPPRLGEIAPYGVVAVVDCKRPEYGQPNVRHAASFDPVGIEYNFILR